MKEAFFEDALLGLMERRRRRGRGEPGAGPPPARSRSLLDLCRPSHAELVTTHTYDYDRTPPYRSSHVTSPGAGTKPTRYQHQGRTDPFLPPGGSLSYAPRMRCRRAQPPSDEPAVAEQIYNEYQEKLVERLDRKANGSLRLNKPKRELPAEPRDFGVVEQVRQEFMGRVQERKDKYGADWDPREQEQEQKQEPAPVSFRIEGTADGISEAIADDVKYLLQQDDSTLILPQFTAKSPHSGKWRPGSSSAPVTSGGQILSDAAKSRAPPSPPSEPVWTPKVVQSPSTQRKEFRPVNYDSDSLKRQQRTELKPAPPPSESFAWTSPEPPIPTSVGDHGNHEPDSFRQDPRSSSRNLPKLQNPTVTLLQQNREGHLPRGAKYLPLDSTPPLAGPNEKLYTIKREYETQTDGATRKFADLAPRPIEGVGPRTHQGMPVTLKSAVKEEHQPEWYKLMYDSLHRAKPDGVRVLYKTKGRYNYQGGGYASEPEAGYASDTGRRAAFGGRDQPDADFGVTSAPRRPLYRNQPGRIEDYLPGRSSLAEREAKQRAARAVSASHPKSFTRAVLDGYDSDSNLVFHRHEREPIAPEEQRSLYSLVQRGGEVPVGGLRKPAPQKPQEPVIGPIPKSMSTSAIPDRPMISPHRARRDERDAAGGEEWREQQARRQLEEERRRRYLQELEDLERRRHGDFFTPAQKSPIPLNRYDNLFDDVTIRSSRGGDTKMAAKALHSFKPINSRELSFSRGDIIFIRRQVDRNWLEGELHGRIGIFPINYVEVVPIDGQRGQPKLGNEGQARARYAFHAQTPVELSLKKGELVTLLRRVDSNWFEGRLGQKVGIFPASYVEVLGRPLPERIETSAKPVGTPAAHGLTSGATSSPGGGLQNQLHVDTSQQEPIPYKALYSYSPQNDDELELRDGDVVYVIEMCEDGWYVGTNGRSGMFGTFPGNYVQKV
ncbi:uncharacterized protein LOC119091433 isoform X2 [Pollicipes pollicipes]|uniref:uncharacterized protein LOC119091433 isoform X2 n=1 Tax=Pollicipes pollicipes TaxID=41117 RepID=UPI00188541DB|nr:uncharacterized protein LOC119091433 isoform X2 [Pollicipes pollicipes]